MRTATICKSFTFDAAHQILRHRGKCKNLHGHTYKVELFLTGPIKEDPSRPDDGMVVDFDEVTEVYKRLVHARLDHQFLNAVIPDLVPTAENIAYWIYSELKEELPSLEAVRVWETPTSWAEYRDIR